MELNIDKIDEDILALLYLTVFHEKDDLPWRTWKSHDWEVMDRLAAKGYISDAKSKAKSVLFTDKVTLRQNSYLKTNMPKRANEALQATGAACSALEGAGDSQLPGFSAASFPAPVPEL